MPLLHMKLAIISSVLFFRRIVSLDSSPDEYQQQLRRNILLDPKTIESKDEFLDCDWDNNASDCIEKSSILDNSDKIVVSFAIRETHIDCIGKRVLEMRQYAQNVGADFVFVDSIDHESLGEVSCPQAEPRFYKFWMIQHYIRKYNQVLYLDESQRMTNCAPNLFTLPYDPSNLLAVIEVDFPRETAMEHACKNYGVDCYNTKKMFNSGLMLYHKQYHERVFETPPPCDRLRKTAGFEDQALFNAWIQKFDVHVVDLNMKGDVVLQGRRITGMMSRREKVEAPILHITRGGRKHLCNDFECVEPEKIF